MANNIENLTKIHVNNCMNVKKVNAIINQYFQKSKQTFLSN